MKKQTKSEQKEIERRMARRNLKKEDVQRVMLELDIKDDVIEANVEKVRDSLIKSNQFNNVQNREAGKLSNVKCFMLHVKKMKYKNFKTFDKFEWKKERDDDDILEVVAFDGSRRNFQFNELETVNIKRCKNEYVHLKFKKVSDGDIDREFIFYDPNNTFKSEFEKRFDCIIDFDGSESETESDDDGEPQASTSASTAAVQAVSIFIYFGV